MVYGHYTNHIVYDNEPLTFSTTVNCVKYKQKKKTQKRTKIVAKIKRYRDKMKPNTDKYEQMKKKGNKNNMKIKERKKNDIAMPKEMKRQNREQQRWYRAKQKARKNKNKNKTKQTKKITHPIKEMN